MKNCDFHGRNDWTTKMRKKRSNEQRNGHTKIGVGERVNESKMKKPEEEEREKRWKKEGTFEGMNIRQLG